MNICVGLVRVMELSNQIYPQYSVRDQSNFPEEKVKRRVKRAMTVVPQLGEAGAKTKHKGNPIDRGFANEVEVCWEEPTS